MATLQDYRDERLRKLTELKELGYNPYPADSHRTHVAKQVIDEFDVLEGQQVTIAGRVIGIRKFGKIAFVVVEDWSGKIQLFLRTGELSDRDPVRGLLGMAELPLLDTGDYVEATGSVIKTQTGEVSVGATELRLLTKSLRPTPETLTNKKSGFAAVISICVSTKMYVLVLCAEANFGKQPDRSWKERASLRSIIPSSRRELGERMRTLLCHTWMRLTRTSICVSAMSCP